MRRDLVYLVQTDTTAGFLSCSAQKLASVKKRPPQRPFLVALASFAATRQVGRVPEAHRRFVRRARKASFILPNGRSFRVIEGSHRLFVEKFGACYTTSANRHKEPFDEAYARRVCEVVVESKEGFCDKSPSKIWRLGRRGKVKVR